MLKNSLFVML